MAGKPGGRAPLAMMCSAADLVGLVLEVDEVAGLDVDRADAEAGLPGVDAVEIDQAFQQALERLGVVEAKPSGTAAGVKIGGGTRGWKKLGAPNIRMPSARHWLTIVVLEVVAELQPADVRDAERRAAHRLPELAQLVDALGGGVAGDDRRVDRADRDAGHAIGMQVGFGQAPGRRRPGRSPARRHPATKAQSARNRPARRRFGQS